jgi:hypothetical protein
LRVGGEAGAEFDRRSNPDRRSLVDRRSPIDRFSSSVRVSAPLRRSAPERLPTFNRSSALDITASPGAQWYMRS